MKIQHVQLKIQHIDLRLKHNKHKWKTTCTAETQHASWLLKHDTHCWQNNTARPKHNTQACCWNTTHTAETQTVLLKHSTQTHCWNTTRTVKLLTKFIHSITARTAKLQKLCIQIFKSLHKSWKHDLYRWTNTQAHRWNTTRTADNTTPYVLLKHSAKAYYWNNAYSWHHRTAESTHKLTAETQHVLLTIQHRTAETQRKSLLLKLRRQLKYNMYCWQNNTVLLKIQDERLVPCLSLNFTFIIFLLILSVIFYLRDVI